MTIDDWRIGRVTRQASIDDRQSITIQQSTIGRSAAAGHHCDSGREETNGRYEGLAVSSRVATLLPEWGKDLAALHTRQANQFRVTVERKARGSLQSPRIEIARQGLAGTVSIDGYLP